MIFRGNHEKGFNFDCYSAWYIILAEIPRNIPKHRTYFRIRFFTQIPNSLLIARIQASRALSLGCIQLKWKAVTRYNKIYLKDLCLFNNSVVVNVIQVSYDLRFIQGMPDEKRKEKNAKESLSALHVRIN